MSPWVVILFLVTSDLFVAQLGINQDGSVFLHHLDKPSEDGDCDATNKKYVGNFYTIQEEYTNYRRKNWHGDRGFRGAI